MGELVAVFEIIHLSRMKEDLLPGFPAFQEVGT